MDIQVIVKNFLQKHHDQKSPLLIALSGGADSMALFEALLEHKKNISLHVAHIDHGWRKESRSEALELQALANKNHIPFHLHCLKKVPSTNKEEYSRIERLNFYLSLTKKFLFQAVLLAHHQGDLAETVLKRVFEGARLQKLHGMQEISLYEGLALWRPLLSLSKKELKSYLLKKNISWFEDKTNLDKNYLRARMREEIFPFLEKSFGKNFLENLLYMSKRSFDLKENLESRLLSLIQEKKGPFGSYYDLSCLRDLSLFEKEHFFCLLFENHKLKPHRKLLEKILSWQLPVKTAKKVLLQGTQVIIDRQKIFFLKQFPLTVPESLFLHLGKKEKWANGFCVELVDSASSSNSWKESWKGECKLALPEGKYELSLLQKGEDKAILRWWNQKKIPVFLRSLFPVLKKEGIICGDFLSGYLLDVERLNDNKCCSTIN